MYCYFPFNLYGLLCVLFCCVIPQLRCVAFRLAVRFVSLRYHDICCAIRRILRKNIFALLHYCSSVLCACKSLIALRCVALGGVGFG